MNKLFALFLTLSTFSTPLLAAPDRLTITFFGSSTCRECNEIKQALLEPIGFEFDTNTIKIVYKDIEKAEDMAASISMEKAYGLTESSPQELYLPDTTLFGYDLIMKHGDSLIRAYIATPSKWEPKYASVIKTDTVQATVALKKRVSNWTFVGLFAAGFVDGINPCAIGTMIFLISFLGTQKRNRKDMLKIGLAFTGTVFVTYFLIGLGAFRLLTMMDQYYWISLSIRAFAVILAVSVAVVCLWDAVVFYRTKDVKLMKDQLPKPIKMLIHSVIKDNLSSEKIIVGAMIAAFFITLLEGVCTAKIYLPTIVLMTQQFGFRALGWLLLVFYNFLFVLPLLIVLISAAYGLKWDRLSKFTQSHLPLMKVLLALVLLALAVFLTIG